MTITRRKDHHGGARDAFSDDPAFDDFDAWDAMTNTQAEMAAIMAEEADRAETRSGSPFAGTRVVSAPVARPVDGPTEKQTAFIAKLAAERGVEVPTPATKRAASAEIDRLMALPKVARTSTAKADPPEGIHFLDGEVFKVQEPRVNGGRRYAKRLTETGFEYVGRPANFSKLSESTLLSLEEAQEYGRLYGRCVVCGSPLTDETSIAAGIGPVCATKGF